MIESKLIVEEQFFLGMNLARAEKYKSDLNQIWPVPYPYYLLCNYCMSIHYKENMEEDL